MLRPLQHRTDGREYPLWVRSAVGAWVLFLCVLSCVQAAHTHGELLPHKAAQVSTLADGAHLAINEELCPLCAAMHSALPSFSTPTLTTFLVSVPLVRPALDRLPDRHWHFDLFSRPPPARVLA